MSAIGLGSRSESDNYMYHVHAGGECKMKTKQHNLNIFTCQRN